MTRPPPTLVCRGHGHAAAWRAERGLPRLPPTGFIRSTTIVSRRLRLRLPAPETPLLLGVREGPGGREIGSVYSAHRPLSRAPSTVRPFDDSWPLVWCAGLHLQCFTAPPLLAFFSFFPRRKKNLHERDNTRPLFRSYPLNRRCTQAGTHTQPTQALRISSSMRETHDVWGTTARRTYPVFYLIHVHVHD